MPYHIRLVYGPTDNLLTIKGCGRFLEEILLLSLVRARVLALRARHKSMIALFYAQQFSFVKAKRPSPFSISSYLCRLQSFEC